MSDKKIFEIKQYIESADLALQQAKEILTEMTGEDFSSKSAKKKAQKVATAENVANIIEGVFNGQNMIGPDGKEYSVPANYASKSKLVEGDVLKLTIQDDGSFLYKQIKPVERQRIQGKLILDEEKDQFCVIADDGKKYNVITAAVTYFKAKVGERLTILVPKNKTCQWAAIENILQTTENTAGNFTNVNLDLETKIPIKNFNKSDVNSPSIDQEETKATDNPDKIQAEREKIEKIINSDDLDINSLGDKDLADL